MGSGWATTTTTISAIRLEQIRVDPFAPEFAKPHPKQESIWARQYADGFVKAPLDDYPTPELVVDPLRDGLSTAQDLVYSVGMAPSDTCEYEGGTIAVMMMMTITMAVVVVLVRTSKGMARALRLMTGFITCSDIQEISSEEAVLSVTSQTTIPTAAMMLTLQMA